MKGECAKGDQSRRRVGESSTCKRVMQGVRGQMAAMRLEVDENFRGRTEEEKEREGLYLNY